jgi:hypothetical protein
LVGLVPKGPFRSQLRLNVIAIEHTGHKTALAVVLAAIEAGHALECWQKT